MLTFYKQMFYGLLQFTYMTGATVSNFSLEKFVASSTGCDGSFKLKHKKLMFFCELLMEERITPQLSICEASLYKTKLLMQVFGKI